MRSHSGFIEILTPPDGDCFYHSVMLNIMHDVLTGGLSEESQTASAIKNSVLPAIQAQLQTMGVPVDFSGQTLKQSMMVLLKLAPISKLPSELAARFTTGKHENDELNAITQCDLYHLFHDVTGPALRNVMTQGMQIPANDLEGQVKKLLRAEFFAYVKSQHSESLGLDRASDEYVSAHNRFCSGELYAVDAELKTTLLSSWKTAFEQGFRSTSAISELSTDKQLKQIFSNWWAANKERAYATYVAIHAKPNVMASLPQQKALGSALHCNFTVVRPGTTSVQASSHGCQLSSATAFHLTYAGMHFNAAISKVTPLHPVSNALQKHAKAVNDNRVALKGITYSWSASANAHAISPIEQPAAVVDMLSIAAVSTKTVVEQLEQTDPAGIVVGLPNLWDDTIKAAQSGYSKALLHTTFGASASFNSVTELATKNKEEVAKIVLTQSDQDFLLAVQLQNEEIEKLLRSKR